jgi:imidazolonepropionase-like amidohydrolase
MYAAARAVHYGLSVEDALKSMTINAAITLGLDHRIGKLETGFDADIVIWDRHPLSLGAAPRAVYIEGALKHTGAPPVLPPPFPPPELEANRAAFRLTGPCDTATEGGLVDLASYSVTADVIWTMDTGYQSTIRSNGVVVVEDGIVTCVGTNSRCAGDMTRIPQLARFTTNGEMFAGMVAAGDGIGTQSTRFLLAC